MPRTPRLLLTGLATIFLAAPGWSAQPDATNGNVSRIWMMNIGSAAAEVRVERSLDGTESDETLTVGPAEVAEVRRSAGEEVRFSEQRDLLIVTASPAFDPSAIRVSGSPAAALGRRQDAVQATGKAPAGGWLKKGESVSAQGAWMASEARTVRLGLRGKSMAEVRLKKHDGEFLGYVTVSAVRPVEMTIDFGPLLDASRYWGMVRREITAHQGQVANLDAQAGEMRSATAASNGTGYFNYNINWELTPALRYYVDAGPANTCGESNVQRNGTWYFTGNWLCTDGSGDAAKGPWYWSDQTGDERAVAFIRWPDNTTTTTDDHIWDVTCPSIFIDYWLFPPSGWGGWATDPSNGACFGWDSRIYATFQDLDTGLWWNGTSYTSSSVSKHYSSAPTPGSCYWSWSTSRHSSHTSGHRYRWKVCVQENIYESNCEACESFEFQQ